MSHKRAGLTKASKNSQSTPQLPTAEAYPAPVELHGAHATVSSGTGGQISINVNITGRDDGSGGVAPGSGFGNAGRMQAKDSAGIVETAISPTHKKRRGNRTGDEDVTTEYTVPGGINVKAAKEFLTKHNWPSGLQEALLRSCERMPIRFFITDDSGSMLTNDGHRIVGSGDKTKLISCTRWSELSASLKFHAELAHVANAPSEFRLLNNAEPVLVGMPGDEEAFTLVKEIFGDGPGGKTPVCAQINAVVAKISKIEDILRANNQRAAVIICTDGVSTDGDVAEAMRPLQNLPVWVVVRLCTDEDEVIDYWNNIDGELELEMDVLDDVEGEAKEVRAVNDFLFYGEPLHRMREFGAALKEMDLIDEDTLSSEQMSVIVSHLCCGATDLPHPDEDWDAFIAAVKSGLKKTKQCWDPIEKRMVQWIHLANLESKYGDKKKGSSACVVS